MAPKFFLIDGHSHCYKAFYALRNLTSPDGQPTNLVFGFASTLRKLIREHQPEYLAVAFDDKAKTFRHGIYEPYKATRKRPPDEFTSQLPVLHELLDAMRVPRFQVPGYEADDIMGTLAKQAAEKGVDVYLVTTDKDAEQLLGPRVRMYDASKEEEKTVETLKRKKGIEPRQVVDVMALAGDSSDNVPGVPKIGPVTAAKLIREHGGLEETLRAAKTMNKSALRKRLLEHAEDARLSRKLVEIDCGAPVEFDAEELARKAPDTERLRGIYERLGFRQFLEEMDSDPTKGAKRYTLVDTPQRFSEFLEDLKRQKRFAFDLESTSQRPTEADVVGFSFSWKAEEGFYVPVRVPEGARALDPEETLGALKPILGDAEIKKVGQNLKYDAVVLLRHGVVLRGIDFDTMIAAYLLNPESRRFGLDDLAVQYLSYRCVPISDLIGKGAKQVTIDKVDVGRVCEYACEDADIAWRLWEALGAKLREAGLADLFREIEIPLIDTLAQMEHNGVKVNVALLKEMSDWLTGKIQEIEERIKREAGAEFNPASPKQLAEVLFEKLQLPAGRKTKTGSSTDADVLAQLQPLHPVPGLVLQYRQWVKLKNTYVDALPELVHPETGRIHTSFSQTAAATGRLSSRDPNLQNIPVRTEFGNRIRKAFVPSQDGWAMMSSDYSQIELRILAHLSGDEALRAAFQADRDIHRFVAAQVFGVPEEAVTDEQRRTAKAVNFGIVYGLTAYGLSRDIGVPVQEAETFISAYFSRHPGVREFIDQTLERARERGFVETMRGRMRPVRDIESRNPNARSFAERAAVNTVVQGSAADMIKIAMVSLGKRLSESKLSARMLLQIHDELLLECPPGEVDALRAMVVSEMEGAMPLDVPVKVNVAVGPNWQEAK